MRTNILASMKALGLLGAMLVAGCAGQGDQPDYGFDDADATQADVNEGKADSVYSKRFAGKYGNDGAAFGHFKFLQLMPEDTRGGAFQGVFDKGREGDPIVTGTYTIGDDVISDPEPGHIKVMVALKVETTSIPLNSTIKNYFFDLNGAELAVRQYDAKKPAAAFQWQQMGSCQACKIEQYDPVRKYDDTQFRVHVAGLRVEAYETDGEIPVRWDDYNSTEAYPDPVIKLGTAKTNVCKNKAICTDDDFTVDAGIYGVRLRGGIPVQINDDDGIHSDDVIGKTTLKLAPGQLADAAAEGLSVSTGAFGRVKELELLITRNVQ